MFFKISYCCLVKNINYEEMQQSRCEEKGEETEQLTSRLQTNFPPRGAQQD